MPRSLVRHFLRSRREKIPEDVHFVDISFNA